MHPTCAQNACLNQSPVVDLYESDSNYLLVAELPGVSPQGITISLESQELRVEARLQPTEQGPPDFARRFKVPREIDEQNIEADMRDGLLSVRLPKTPQASARRIEVKVN